MIRPSRSIVPLPLVLMFSACIVFAVMYTAVLSVIDTASRTAYDDPALTEKNARIIAYISGPLFMENPLDFLPADERSHMTDVKELLDTTFIIYLVCLGIIIGVLSIMVAQRMWPRIDELLGRALQYSGWTILAMMLFLVLAALLDFGRLWLLFHAVFFPQGNWAFAQSSTLITLYPGTLFERLVLRWLLLVTGFGIVALALSHLLERMRRHDEFFTAAFEQKAHKGKQHKQKR